LQNSAIESHSTIRKKEANIIAARIWASKVTQVTILIVLVTMGYCVFAGRISTRFIGVVDGGVPTCRLDLIRASENHIEVRVTASNPTPRRIGITKRFLPEWGHVSTKLFEIERNGSEIPFKGRFIDKAETATDVLQIDPGTEASVRVSITKAGYDVSGHGEFSIIYKTAAWDDGQVRMCKSNALTIKK
jgi:hypothetical protein